MHASRFDTLTRSLTTAGSRRRALAAALSGALVPLLAREKAAAHNKRKKCQKKSGKAKKKCRKKAEKHQAQHAAETPPPSGVTCAEGQTVCGGACVDLDTDPYHCGGCGSACGQLCAQGECVTEQGSCAAGADLCSASGSYECGTNCYCFTTMAEQTRCGESLSGSACPQCTSDADCETLFPTIPGVFCVKDTGAGCGCPADGQGFCRQPCLNPT